MIACSCWRMMVCLDVFQCRSCFSPPDSVHLAIQDFSCTTTTVPIPHCGRGNHGFGFSGVRVGVDVRLGRSSSFPSFPRIPELHTSRECSALWFPSICVGGSVLHGSRRSAWDPLQLPRQYPLCVAAGMHSAPSFDSSLCPQSRCCFCCCFCAALLARVVQLQ